MDDSGNRAAHPAWGDVEHTDVEIVLADVRLPGIFSLPHTPGGVVVFAHGASHLFVEPGTLEAAARLAGAWFKCHPGTARSAA